MSRGTWKSGLIVNGTRGMRPWRSAAAMADDKLVGSYYSLESVVVDGVGGVGPLDDAER